MNPKEQLMSLLESVKQANSRLIRLERKSVKFDLAEIIKAEGKQGNFFLRKVCFVIGHKFDHSKMCWPSYRAHCLRCKHDQYSAFPAPWTVAGWLEKRSQ